MPARTGPLLVVAAYPPELCAVPETLREATGVACATVGIGVVAAAVGTARLLAEVSPRAVLLVGTAGAYPGARFLVGRAAVVRVARLADPAATLGVGAVPTVVRTRIAADRALLRTLRAAGATPADAATTFGITTDDALAKRLARATPAALEHMETFGVAAACAAAKVPFAAVLGVANAVGKGSREAFRRGEAKALSAVEAVLTRSARRLQEP